MAIGIVRVIFAGICTLMGVTLLSTTTLDVEAQIEPSLQQIVANLATNERDAAQHKPPYLYTSVERSDRTGGHLWTERVAEVVQGKLHYLVAEDGHPLSAERHNAEVARLKAIVADPGEFIREEQARKNDEQHAQQLLTLLPRGFLFSNLGVQDQWLRINFRPNPAYIPQSYEERVLHGMSGTMLVDFRNVRLHHLEARLDSDITFGLGLVATVRSGSNFAMTRDAIAPGIWKTTAIDVDIHGRALLFKTIARQQHAEHRSFLSLPANLSIQQAVALLLK